LSDDVVETIKNVMGGKFPEGSYNPYEPWVDWFTNKVMDTPVTSQPEHKRSFLPSRVEAIKGISINIIIQHFLGLSECFLL
jgi:ribosome biogenesis protein ERB1